MPENPDRTDKMRFKTQGITCRECAADMEKVLKDKDGIKSVSVDYDTDIVDISFDTNTLTKKDVYTTVRKIGVRLEILKD
jgi:Cu+-exporting ATPase